MANFTPQEIEQFLQEFFDTVGARQYVGARYIPIFGRAGSDTVEWDDLAPYEPLTVVMHDGVSYVSRRYVPAGIQITDINYWVETYRFNAQVEQYRQEVLSFQGQIDTINQTIEDDYVPFPDGLSYPKYGILGQVLSTLADGTVKWQDPVVPSDSQAEEVITDWLDANPDKVVNIQPGSVATGDIKPNNVVIPYVDLVTSQTINDANDFPNNYIVKFSNSDSGIANLPDNCSLGVLVTLSGSNASSGNNYTSFKFQILAAYGSAAEMRRTYYMRSCWSTVWTQWVKVSTDSNILEILTDAKVDTAQLKDNSVTAAKLGSSSVTNDKMYPRAALIPYNTLVESSDFADADNFPNNYIVKFRNPSADIAHIPEGVLFGVIATIASSSGNDATSLNQYKFQILAGYGTTTDSRRTFYMRSAWSGGYMDWVRINTDINRFDGVNPSPDSYENLYNLFSAHNIVILGDSISAGQGSTGYVSFTKEIDGVTYSIRGNGPDYPDAGPGYQVGSLLWENGTSKWYTPIDGRGWSQLFKAYIESKFRNSTVTIDAMSGTNANQMSSFLTNLISGKNYDLALIMYGTNNRTTSYANFASSMESAIKTLRAANIKPIVMCSVPASVSDEESHTYHMEDVEHVLKNVCMKTHTPFINLYEEFMDYCWMSGTTIDSLLADGLHPNDNGYQVIFNLVTRALNISRKRPNATW